MGCRCAEISRLTNEIERLDYALDYTQKAYNNSENTKQNIMYSGSNFDWGVMLACKETDIASKLKSSYDSAIDCIEDACSKIKQAIDEVESELEEARRDDRYYHEHKHHHDD